MMILSTGRYIFNMAIPGGYYSICFIFILFICSFFFLQLTVSELNYIKQYDQGSKSQNDEGVRHGEGMF